MVETESCFLQLLISTVDSIALGAIPHLISIPFSDKLEFENSKKNKNIIVEDRTKHSPH